MNLLRIAGSRNRVASIVTPPTPPTPPGPVINPEAQAWADQVVLNGGGAVSEARVQAASDLCDALDAAGISSKLKFMLLLTDGGLIEATTPLYQVGGNNPWQNVFFVDGSLTANGLCSGGTNKYLRSGLIPSGILSRDDCGLTAYVSEWNGATASDNYIMRCSIGDFSGVFGLTSTRKSTEQNAWFHAGYGVSNFGSVSGAQGEWWNGYISGNRNASNSAKIFRARSDVAHAQLAVNTGNATGVLPNNELFAFGANNSGSYASAIKERMSFLAGHEALTEAQSSDFYDAIQAFRTAVGGGFV